MMDRNRNSIPEEILFEILTMLPVKSLCRFRCVSKSWFCIISDPNFVDAHLARSNSRPKLLISVNKGDHNYLYSIDYPEEDDDDDDDLSAKPLRLHATAHGSINWHSAIILSASSGLIFCTWPGGIRIGNPITRDFDLIQSPLYHKLPCNVSSFLGFDPIDKRHVMLMVEKGCFGSPAKINAVSLPERQVHEISPHCIRYGGHWITGGGDYSICIDGVIYFIAQTNLSGSSNSTTVVKSRLYAFDIRLKFVEMIQYPDWERMVPVLTEYKGRVAWVGFWNSEYNAYPPSQDHMDEMKLWVLEDTKKQSWSVKSFVVPWGTSESNLRSSLYVKLYGATPRGDLIFDTAISEGGSLDMFLYNVDTNTLRRFTIDGFGPIPHNYRLARFNFLTESLHSPKGKQLLGP